MATMPEMSNGNGCIAWLHITANQSELSTRNDVEEEESLQVGPFYF